MIKLEQIVKNRYQILSLDIIIGDEQFSEIVAINPDNMDFGLIKIKISEYISSEDGKNRESNDSIIQFLIDNDLIIDTVDYFYLPIKFK